MYFKLDMDIESFHPGLELVLSDRKVIIKPYQIIPAIS